MTEREEIKVGSKVRDPLELGGEVIAMYGDAAKVRWNNGQENWISGAWIRLDVEHINKQ